MGKMLYHVTYTIVDMINVKLASRIDLRENLEEPSIISHNISFSMVDAVASHLRGEIHLRQT